MVRNTSTSSGQTYISCGQCGKQCNAFGEEGEYNISGAFFCHTCLTTCRRLNVEPTLGKSAFVQCDQCLHKCRPADGNYDPNDSNIFYCEPCWAEWEDNQGGGGDVRGDRAGGSTQEDEEERLREQIDRMYAKKRGETDFKPQPKAKRREHLELEEARKKLQSQIIQYIARRKKPVPVEEIQMVVTIDFRRFGTMTLDAFIRNIPGVSVRFNSVEMCIVAYLTGSYEPEQAKKSQDKGPTAEDASASQKHAGEKDYYKVLGIKIDASQEDIKKAYRKRALKIHPDRHQDDKERYEQEFKELTKMYETLRDPNERHLYDIYLKRATRRRGGKVDKGFTQADGSRFATQDDLKDFFQSVDDFLLAHLMDLDSDKKSASFRDLAHIVHTLKSFVPTTEEAEDLDDVDTDEIESSLSSHWWYSASGVTVGPQPLAVIVDAFIRKVIKETTYVIDQKKVTTWTALSFVKPLYLYLRAKRQRAQDANEPEEVVEKAKPTITGLWICEKCKEENGYKRRKCVGCDYDPQAAEKRLRRKKAHERKKRRKHRKQLKKEKEVAKIKALPKDKKGKPILWKPGELPPGWIEFKDPKGRPYYLNKPKNKTTWEHPNPAPKIQHGLWPPTPWRPVWGVDRQRYFENGERGVRVALADFQKQMAKQNYFVPRPDPEFLWEEYYDKSAKASRWINRRTNAIAARKPPHGTWPPKFG